MAWPDFPEDPEVEKRIKKIQEELKGKTMTCPHCDSLVFLSDVKELGYCPECEENIE